MPGGENTATWSQANGVWGPKRSLKACHGTATSQWFPERKAWHGNMKGSDACSWTARISFLLLFIVMVLRITVDKKMENFAWRKWCVAQESSRSSLPHPGTHVASGSFAAAEPWGCGVSARHVNHKIALLSLQCTRFSDLKVLHEFLADDHQSFSLPSNVLQWLKLYCWFLRTTLTWGSFYMKRETMFFFGGEISNRRMPSFLDQTR